MSLLLLFRGVAAPDYAPKPKKRFFVRHNEQVLAFASRREATAAIRRLELRQDVAPAETISLPDVKVYAQDAGKLDAYNAAFAAGHYAGILKMFDDMREEEDLEYLLMAL